MTAINPIEDGRNAMDDNQPDDEPLDPVEAMNRAVLGIVDTVRALVAAQQRMRELLAIDLELDEQLEKLERITHDDVLGMEAFGDRDEWIDKRLGDG
jgi:hypothetical protein